MMHQCKALVTVSIPALQTHSSSRSLKTFDTIVFSVLQLVNMVRQVIVRGLLLNSLKKKHVEILTNIKAQNSTYKSSDNITWKYTL